MTYMPARWRHQSFLLEIYTMLQTKRKERNKKLNINIKQQLKRVGRIRQKFHAHFLGWRITFWTAVVKETFVEMKSALLIFIWLLQVKVKTTSINSKGGIFPTAPSFRGPFSTDGCGGVGDVYSRNPRMRGVDPALPTTMFQKSLSHKPK